MNDPARSRGPDLQTLFDLFATRQTTVATFETVAADAVPSPYQGLLVHEYHMTVTVEAHYHDRVYTRILERVGTPEWYARMILLCLEGNHRPVQFGIVRMYYKYLSDAVRAAVLAGHVPLGRILIEHNVLRRIEPTAFLRVVPGSRMMEWFGLNRPVPTYGRLALIHCDDQPAVELLEIVAPE